MPFYKYVCQACGTTFHLMHAPHEGPENKCGYCDKEGTLVRSIDEEDDITIQKHKKQKTGAVVNEFINQNRNQLQQEREALRRRMYKTGGS